MLHENAFGGLKLSQFARCLYEIGSLINRLPAFMSLKSTSGNCEAAHHRICTDASVYKHCKLMRIRLHASRSLNQMHGNRCSLSWVRNCISTFHISHAGREHLHISFPASGDNPFPPQPLPSSTLPSSTPPCLTHPVINPSRPQDKSCPNQDLN